MYTPQEVSEKTFPKSSGLSSGYSMTAVDEFLDGLTEDYTALYKDNTTLTDKLKVLAEKVEEYRATEDAMRSTLLAAQKMAAQMVAAPQENAVPVAEAATDAEPASQEEPSQEQQPDPEPQPPEEKPQEKKEEDSPFPLDFKLNLEDLQFGRNYNGGDRR